MSMSILQLSSKIKSLLTKYVRDEELARAFGLLSNVTGMQMPMDSETVIDELRSIVGSVSDEGDRTQLLDLLIQLDHPQVPLVPNELEVQQVVRYLPDTLQDLAYLIGVPLTLTISKVFGGTRLYIPQSLAENQLVQTIGKDAMLVLIEAFGGQSIEIPRGTAWHARTKWLEIKRLSESGFSEARLARLFGVTERWIRIVRGKSVADPNQLELPF